MWSLQLTVSLMSMASIAIGSPFLRDRSGVEARDGKEVQVFKRDAPLEPEDLVLAELHGVNTTEMFKHSVIKRRGEESVTIWVDKSYEDLPGPDEDVTIAGRALKVIDNIVPASNGDQCGKSSFRDQTDSTAPLTGGVNQIRDWGRKTNGIFRFYNLPNNYRTLVAAGTNSGGNARFRARRTNTEPGAVGTRDIGDLADSSLSRFAKNYDGRWRLRASGSMDCQLRSKIDWWINKWDHKV